MRLPMMLKATVPGRGGKAKPKHEILLNRRRQEVLKAATDRQQPAFTETPCYSVTG